jgi:hypothetical protein
MLANKIIPEAPTISVLESKMCKASRDVTPLKDALDHLRAALSLLDAAAQHSAAAHLDQVIHDIQATVNAGSENS